MPNKYLEVVVSAENEAQANNIMDALLDKKLVTGGMMVKAPAKFWWKGKRISMQYYSVSSFTIRKNMKAIISEVKKVSIEEVPMVRFVSFEANTELLKWIDKTIK